MAAKAVVTVTAPDSDDAVPVSRTTLTLPVGARPRPEKPAEVVVFQEARADLPRPYVTSDAAAAEARKVALHQREWESRVRARTILRQWRAGDPGAGGQAMLARPHKDVPVAFLSPDTLEAALTRRFADSHLIDRMWDNGQLNDGQYAAANKLLQLCDDAGMLASKVAMLGRVGTGYVEMSDGMAAAWYEWHRCMRLVGQPADEMLSQLCHGTLAIRGQGQRAQAMRDGLHRLARRWGIDTA
ncbi:hypothetical protein IBL26_23460 [Roseomonas aerophila]|uniref:Uncharacterized protein n=1 Tax=Teichococcus aerophilus TaxID=1224513 RepID=A0ABR7RUN9_9PROT|nr:hypothetical protein [Pseudoroseomonas aerophila]MBC9209815.1 hypothetical protein [Pseudoroseomonas aerophila]